MIKKKDGVHISQGRNIVVADSRKQGGDINFVSHAHFDHLYKGTEEVLCSDATAELASARLGEEVDYTTSCPDIELIPSGHVIGSRSALVYGDRKILYTGDVSTRDRMYLKGFNPPEADILVLETTYGLPVYEFPDQRDIEREIKGWIEEESRPLILFGYSLGKAQKIQFIVQELTDRSILAHQKVLEMNKAVEKVSDVTFDAVSFEDNKDLFDDNSILIAPPACSRSKWLEKLVGQKEAVKAGFSGWASQDSYRFRGKYDRTFVLSDHCDFNELVNLVEKVDPEKVYTHHGFNEAFASYIRQEMGIRAQALKANQLTLNDF